MSTAITLSAKADSEMGIMAFPELLHTCRLANIKFVSLANNHILDWGKSWPPQPLIAATHASLPRSHCLHACLLTPLFSSWRRSAGNAGYTTGSGQAGHCACRRACYLLAVWHLGCRGCSGLYGRSVSGQAQSFCYLQPFHTHSDCICVVLVQACLLASGCAQPAAACLSNNLWRALQALG